MPRSSQDNLPYERAKVEVQAFARFSLQSQGLSDRRSAIGYSRVGGLFACNRGWAMVLDTKRTAALPGCGSQVNALDVDSSGRFYGVPATIVRSLSSWATLCSLSGFIFTAIS